jgi:circadian clock protein KaiC
MFLFDESIRAMLTRSTGLGLDVQSRIREGTIQVQAIDPAELSPGEFIHGIRTAVEQSGATVVVIDSLNGYLNSMAEEKFILVQLHELLSYLGQLGVVTLLINAQIGLIGQMSSSVDVSYLADTVILLRYFEAAGEVRQAIAILKKRTGRHERSIRELRIDPQGVHISEPLRQYQGVLTGIPQQFQEVPQPVHA